MTKTNRPLAVITGASRGLGALIAAELAANGADLLLVARDKDQLGQVIADIAAQSPDARVHALLIDLNEAEAIERVVDKAEELGGAQILINNAAVLGPVGPSWSVSSSEFRKTIDLDFVIPALLANAFVARMIARGEGWLVSISGGGATSPRPNVSAYGAAKTALVRFTETLSVEAAPYGLRANAIAPGAFASGMTKAILAKKEDSGESERALAERLLQNKEQSAAERAAKLVCYLTIGEGRNVSGKLISAVWDPWETLHETWDQISSKDIYTLRRIVPET